MTLMCINTLHSNTGRPNKLNFPKVINNVFRFWLDQWHRAIFQRKQKKTNNFLLIFHNANYTIDPHRPTCRKWSKTSCAATMKLGFSGWRKRGLLKLSRSDGGDFQHAMETTSCFSYFNSDVIACCSTLLLCASVWLCVCVCFITGSVCCIIQLTLAHLSLPPLPLGTVKSCQQRPSWTRPQTNAKVRNVVFLRRSLFLLNVIAEKRADLCRHATKKKRVSRPPSMQSRSSYAVVFGWSGQVRKQTVRLLDAASQPSVILSLLLVSQLWVGPQRKWPGLLPFLLDWQRRPLSGSRFFAPSSPQMGLSDSPRCCGGD